MSIQHFFIREIIIKIKNIKKWMKMQVNMYSITNINNIINKIHKQQQQQRKKLNLIKYFWWKYHCFHKLPFVNKVSKLKIY